MSTTPVFSKEYYTNQWMFNKDVIAVQAPDGGMVIQAGFLTNLLKFRYTHATVDNNTITTVPFSFFDNVKRCFTFAQDPNLIAVHRKLKEIESSSDDELSRIQHEVHKEGFRGAEILKSNIETLSSLFDKANKKSIVTLTLLKVVNLFRKLLHLQPIEFASFGDINRHYLEEAVIKPALEIFTPLEKASCNFSITVQNSPNFPSPPELTENNVQKLELGLLGKLNFSIEKHQLALEFDRAKKEFVLLYEGSHSALTSLLNDNTSYFSRTEDQFLRVDQTFTTQLLKCTTTASRQKGPWYFPFHEVKMFERTPGRMTLAPGFEYAILLSRGELGLNLKVNNLNA